MQRVRSSFPAPVARQRWRRVGDPRNFGAVLEVYLVPRTQDLGYLWAYVWSIPVTRSQGEAFFRLKQVPGRRGAAAVAALTRRVVSSAAQRGLPFGPGSLADYEIVMTETALRLNLSAAGAP